MTPDVVVDVGNTCVKWGRCAAGAVADVASLPPDDPAAWDQQLAAWGLGRSLAWAVASVHPARRDRLATWICGRDDRIAVVGDPALLPLRVLLPRPDQVGIDRLADAVAANERRPAGKPAVVVDAGSAVTVDWVDADGAFHGGAILPGLGLMAQTLHEHTALLPRVTPPRQPPPLPGTSTTPAIEAGIYYAVAGGIAALVRAYRVWSDADPVVFLTGGDAPALLPALGPGVVYWPEMTLEGIRRSAEALP
jgi:type III pantothenate kinase